MNPLIKRIVEGKDAVLAVIEDTKPVKFFRCPHCREEIYEKHTYTDDNDVSRHSDCGGAIAFPPPSAEEIACFNQWLGIKN
jgi:hypothetical protein